MLIDMSRIARLCLEQLVPTALYYGHFTNEAEYQLIRWNDTRPKPDWSQLEEQQETVSAIIQWNEYKEVRTETVKRIIVEVDGIQFDGDEDSQNRMVRAASLLDKFEVSSQPWKTADNQVVNATAAQLWQAARLAGEAQSSVWFTPQPTEE